MVSFVDRVKRMATSFHYKKHKFCNSFSYLNTGKQSILKSENRKRKNKNTQKSKKQKNLNQYFVISKKQKPQKKSYDILLFGTKRGSLTVEAAMVVPIFLFFCYLMVQVITVTNVQQQVQYSLEVTADTMAGMGIKPTVAQGHTIFLQNMSKRNVNMNIIQNKFLGFSFANTRINENSCMDLQVSYKIIFTNILGKKISIPCRQKVYRKCFTGKTVKDAEDSEYVYITTGDTVYHTNRYCTHLALSISQVSIESIKTQKRYTPCIRCKKMENPGWYYVTKEGDKYHNSLLCSGLKRSIERVKKDEVPNRRMCSRCKKGA